MDPLKSDDHIAVFMEKSIGVGDVPKGEDYAVTIRSLNYFPYVFINALRVIIPSEVKTLNTSDIEVKYLGMLNISMLVERFQYISLKSDRPDKLVETPTLYIEAPESTLEKPVEVVSGDDLHYITASELRARDASGKLLEDNMVSIPSAQLVPIFPGIVASRCESAIYAEMKTEVNSPRDAGTVGKPASHFAAAEVDNYRWVPRWEMKKSKGGKKMLSRHAYLELLKKENEPLPREEKCLTPLYDIEVDKYSNPECCELKLTTSRRKMHPLMVLWFATRILFDKLSSIKSAFDEEDYSKYSYTENPSVSGSITIVLKHERDDVAEIIKYYLIQLIPIDKPEKLTEYMCDATNEDTRSDEIHVRVKFPTPVEYGGSSYLYSFEMLNMALKKSIKDAEYLREFVHELCVKQKLPVD